MRGVDGSGLSRRAFLLRGAWIGGLAVVVAGCRKHESRQPAPDPDAAAISAAVDGEVRLIQMYDAAIEAGGAQGGGLTTAREAHRTHLRALTDRPQLIASHSPTARLPLATQVQHLDDAERSSAGTLRAAAVAVRNGDRAAALASIAAAHAVRADVRPVQALSR